MIRFVMHFYLVYLMKMKEKTQARKKKKADY